MIGALSSGSGGGYDLSWLDALSAASAAQQGGSNAGFYAAAGAPQTPTSNVWGQVQAPQGPSPGAGYNWTTNAPGQWGWHQTSGYDNSNSDSKALATAQAAYDHDPSAYNRDRLVAAGGAPDTRTNPNYDPWAGGNQAVDDIGATAAFTPPTPSPYEGKDFGTMVPDPVPTGGAPSGYRVDPYAGTSMTLDRGGTVYASPEARAAYQRSLDSEGIYVDPYTGEAVSFNDGSIGGTYNPDPVRAPVPSPLTVDQFTPRTLPDADGMAGQVRMDNATAALTEPVGPLSAADLESGVKDHVPAQSTAIESNGLVPTQTPKDLAVGATAALGGAALAGLGGAIIPAITGAAAPVAGAAAPAAGAAAPAAGAAAPAIAGGLAGAAVPAIIGGVGGVAGAAGSIIGANTVASAEEKAAQIQADAATAAAKLQDAQHTASLAELKRQFDAGQTNLAPWMTAGTGALEQLKTFDTQNPHTNVADFSMENFQQDPGYNFRLSEGLKALQNSAAARGQLVSGNSMKALSDFAGQQASQEYGSAFDRYQTQKNNAFNRYQTNLGTKLGSLQSLAGVGQSAVQQANQSGQNYANSIGQAGQNYANQVGQLGMGGAQARAGGVTGSAAANASGYMGASNALTNALSQGYGMWQGNQMLSLLRNR